ncbi:probable serine/threonine-protein kinase DDB_G0280133 isoform X2 [Pecten maximus]|uniref:probable serine/threonine-protein kinase DDB_G0280133 isoform X2 n=1 Tax=Pecten maximus TaxID=6579 RepID=UPI001458D7D9|nr:probable serine/threonine-protein kinase DDB_G0280133 isoform X2 [Pecten maximus]
MATAAPQIRNFQIGRMEQSDTLGSDYHDAARNGNKKKLKKIIGRGIQIDYPNDQGQSPLFIACFENEPSACDLLLNNGANPNERCNDGTTPVHMAAYSGNVKLLSDVLAAGGDLRFHDNYGRTTKDWALCQPDPKRRMKMIEFLEKTKLFALTTSGRDIRMGNKVSSKVHVNRNNSLMHIIMNKIKGGIDANIDHLKSSHSMGFGKVYLDGDCSSGFMTSIPLISESCLKHSGDGLTFENGSFMVMESMMWQSSKVTAKRLHREAEAGGEVDLLITEAEFVGKLRHPNILLLMGVCQTNNLDGLVLLFENVGLGSLYYHLHEKCDRMSTNQIHDILVQICNGIIFLHDQDLLHCYITSHAVFLVSTHIAKLGNLEYAVERRKSEVGKKSLVITNKHQNAAYNWMSPEIISGSCPSEASDMYSFCAIMWECFENMIPWGRCDAAAIRHKMFNDGEQLTPNSGRTPQLFLTLMEYGLQLDPLHRQLRFNHIRDILGLSTEKVKQYISNLLPKQQPFNGNRETITEQEVLKSRQRSSREKGRDGVIQAREQTPQSSRKPQRPKKQPDGPKVNRHDQNQSSRKTKHGNGCYSAEAKVSPDNGYQYKSQDGVSFDIKNTHWDLQEEQNKHEYFYRVKVLPKKENICSHEQGYEQHQQVCDQKQIAVDDHQQQQHHNDLPSYEKQHFHQGYDQQQKQQMYKQQTYEQQPYEKQHLQQAYNQPHQREYDQCHQHQQQMYDQMICDQQHVKSQYDPEHEYRKASPVKGTNHLISSESEESCSTQTSSSQDADHQLNSSLAKPLATRFSYLQIQQGKSPTGVSVKPASHCTAPFESIEKESEKKLSNAGSVYALYNLDCFEGNECTPNRQSIATQNQHYSTMPRKRKRMGMTPEIKNETQMLLKQPGSVRNLVDLYQHQESSHKLKQAVLHGNIKDCMDGDSCMYPRLDTLEGSSDKEINSPNNCNNHGMEQHNFSGGQSNRKTRKSSPSKKNKEIYAPPSSVNDAMNSSSLTTISPCDSASNARMRSPLFDDSPYRDSVPCKMKAKEALKKGKKTDVEEFYFDDELNQDFEEQSNIQLQSPTSPPPASYGLKARKSSFIITPQNSNAYGETKLGDRTAYNQYLCIEKCQQGIQPSPVTEMQTERLVRERPAYVSTVTISSNLKDPEQHNITHTLTDLDNGATNTMYKKSIRASRVVSSLFEQ